LHQEKKIKVERWKTKIKDQQPYQMEKISRKGAEDATQRRKDFVKLRAFVS